MTCRLICTTGDLDGALDAILGLSHGREHHKICKELGVERDRRNFWNAIHALDIRVQKFKVSRVSQYGLNKITSHLGTPEDEYQGDINRYRALLLMYGDFCNLSDVGNRCLKQHHLLPTPAKLFQMLISR